MGANESEIPVLEQQKLEIERQKLKLEEEKQRQDEKLERDKLAQAERTAHEDRLVERHKGRMTAASIFVSVFIPLITLVLTVASGSAADRGRARAEFEVKAAELVLQSQTPDEAYAKARALKNLFPERLSPHFADAFNPKNYEGGPTGQAELTLLKLVIEHPQQKQEIVEKWIKLFPEDEVWAKQLK